MKFDSSNGKKWCVDSKLSVLKADWAFCDMLPFVTQDFLQETQIHKKMNLHLFPYFFFFFLPFCVPGLWFLLQIW